MSCNIKSLERCIDYPYHMLFRIPENIKWYFSMITVSVFHPLLFCPGCQVRLAKSDCPVVWRTLKMLWRAGLTFTSHSPLYPLTVVTTRHGCFSSLIKTLFRVGKTETLLRPGHIHIISRCQLEHAFLRQIKPVTWKEFVTQPLRNHWSSRNSQLYKWHSWLVLCFSLMRSFNWLFSLAFPVLAKLCRDPSPNIYLSISTILYAMNISQKGMGQSRKWILSALKWKSYFMRVEENRYLFYIKTESFYPTEIPAGRVFYQCGVWTWQDSTSFC